MHTQGLAAGLLSLRFSPQYSPSQIDQFCNGLRLFKLGYSWGGPMSLVVPYRLQELRQMASPSLVQGGFVRLSVGLEAASDLIDDLAQAMAQAGM